MTLHATEFLRAREVNPEHVIDSLTLEADDRYRRRVLLTTDGGRDVLIDFRQAAMLDEGDALVTGASELVLIKAAPQALLAVRADDPHLMHRLLWHLGNRHTPTEIGLDCAYIGHDHVLAQMLVGLGARIEEVTRPFRPEGGAYGGHGAAHGHHHHHD
jgi:urease accessory protein